MTGIAENALDGARATPETATSIGPTAASSAPSRKARLPWRARVVIELLARIERGTLRLSLPDGRSLRFGSGEPEAHLDVRAWDVFGAALASGDIGFAESYMEGHWTSDDPARVLYLLALNRDAIERTVYGGFLGGLVARVRHLFNANTRAGSRRNIAKHYDLGNDFYRLWLDPSMTYSSAIFGGDLGGDLQAAQTAKYRRILNRLDPRPGDTILEIGCGWGGFAEVAARERGCRVTGISLSKEQLAYATQRIADAGLADRVTFEMRDYRDTRGHYDHIVSIEMVEAVGERYWPAYFRTIADRLAPGGRAVVQAIVIADRYFARYRAGSDFIQQYVFPGGMLPSPARFDAEARAQGLAVTDAFAFGPDYAETLRRWRAVFMTNLDRIRPMGFDERFVRMWELYLAYCEAAFDSACTDVVQYELRRA